MTGAIYETNLSSLPLLQRGKVRDLYQIDDNRLLIIQTDRISALDTILPTAIPGKGRILTEMSKFWFKKFSPLIDTHYLDDDPLAFVSQSDKKMVRGRSLVVAKTTPLPIEAVVRGYLAGSGWKQYKLSGQICGQNLVDGLEIAEKLEVPIFTPTTKASLGDKDQNISFETMEGLIGSNLSKDIRKMSLLLYTNALDHCFERGIIVADTKFEFGLNKENNLILIDEVLTPDSSRFWSAKSYKIGYAPPSYDKQEVRDWLNDTEDSEKYQRPPEIPDKIITATQNKYKNIMQTLCHSKKI